MARGSAAALRVAMESVIPMGVECVAIVRGPRPRSVWAWLWDLLGLRLARLAGYAIIAADASAPPWHENCRCDTVRKEVE